MKHGKYAPVVDVPSVGGDDVITLSSTPAPGTAPVSSCAERSQQEANVWTHCRLETSVDSRNWHGKPKRWNMAPRRQQLQHSYMATSSSVNFQIINSVAAVNLSESLQLLCMGKHCRWYSLAAYKFCRLRIFRLERSAADFTCIVEVYTGTVPD